MFFLIYKITNLITEQIYIGKHKTEDMNDGYMGSSKILIRHIKKHGKNNLKKEILLECESYEEMTEIENILVDKSFISRPDVLNLRIGGDGGDAVSGKIWINKLDKSKRIVSDKLNIHIDDGWKLGQSENHKKANSQSIKKLCRSWWHNIDENIEILSKETPNENFKPGRLPSPLLGKVGKKHSDYTKEKCRLIGMKKKPGTGEKLKKFKWINKEGTIRRISNNSLETYLSDGWNLGRPFKWTTSSGESKF